tara:strand:+ start:571 stop:813 length:243 start_codon:yes stop_codon:yes gene_type:complete
MGKVNYFHRDGEAERKRSEQMDSKDWDVVIKGYRSWIRHEKGHNDELREWIKRSEELIEMRKKELIAIQHLNQKGKKQNE